jgi:hypothetical protein
VRRLIALTVVALVAVVLASAGNAGSQPVPVGVQHKIAALSASPAYVPTWMPAGFIFIGWKQAAPPNNGTSNGSTVVGQGFTITFARAGRIVLWSMRPGAYNDCVPRPIFDTRTAIRGRAVYYANGNHGDSAYICIGKVEFTTWGDHLFSPSTSMRIAGSARLAR